MGASPYVQSRRLAWLSLAVCALLLATLAGGCATKRIEISSQHHPERSMALISGVDPAEPPADPRFAGLSALEVEASLRRIIVRPSHLVSINRGDPQPLLVGDQLNWVRDVLTAHVPKLKPDQRLEVHFLDRFNRYDVTMEVYGIGGDLAYRFRRLASLPVMPDQINDEKGPDFALVEPQAGQEVSTDRSGVLLRDPVFAGGGSIEAFAQALAEVQKRVDSKRLSEEDVGPIEARLRQQRDLPLEAVRLYLDKLETINQALRQNLFSEQEAASRKQALLDALPASK